MRATAILAALAIAVASGWAELNDRLSPSLDHPAIEYFNYLKHPPQDPVAELKRQIEEGKIQLEIRRRKRLPAGPAPGPERPR